MKALLCFSLIVLFAIVGPGTFHPGRVYALPSVSQTPPDPDAPKPAPPNSPNPSPPSSGNPSNNNGGGNNSSQPPEDKQEVEVKYTSERQMDNVELKEDMKYGIESVISPRIFGNMVSDLFRYIADDSAKAINAESQTSAGGAVASTLAGQLARWSPRSGHLFIDAKQLTDLATVLSSVILPIFALAFLLAIVDILFGMLRGASASFSLALEEIIILSVIVIFAYNSFTITGSLYMLINEVIAGICGTAPTSGPWISAVGGCNKGNVMAQSLLPDIRVRAALHMDSFTVGIFVLSSVVAASLAYVGQIVRLLIGSALLVLAPIAIALESIRFTRGMARAWAMGIFIYAVSLLGCALVLSLYEAIAGESGVLAGAVEDATGKLLARSVGTTALLLVTLIISIAGALSIIPMLFAMAGSTMRGLQLSAGRIGQMLGQAISPGGYGQASGAQSPLGSPGGQAQPRQHPGQKGSGGGGSGGGTSPMGPAGPSPRARPPQPGGKGGGGGRLSPIPTAPPPSPISPVGRALRNVLAGVGVQNVSPQASKLLNNLAAGNMVVYQNSGQSKVIPAPIGRSAIQYAMNILKGMGQQGGQLLAAFGNGDKSMGFVNLAIEAAKGAPSDPQAKDGKGKNKKQTSQVTQDVGKQLDEQADDLISQYLKTAKKDRPDAIPAHRQKQRASDFMLADGVENYLAYQGGTSLVMDTQGRGRATPAKGHFHSPGLGHADDKVSGETLPQLQLYRRAPVGIETGYHSVRQEGGADVSRSPSDVSKPAIVPASPYLARAEGVDHYYSRHENYRRVLASGDALWDHPRWRDDRQWGTATPYVVHHAVTATKEIERLLAIPTPPKIERVVEKFVEIKKVAGDEGVQQVSEALRQSVSYDDLRLRLGSLSQTIVSHLDDIIAGETKRFEHH